MNEADNYKYICIGQHIIEGMRDSCLKSRPPQFLISLNHSVLTSPI